MNWRWSNVWMLGFAACISGSTLPVQGQAAATAEAGEPVVLGHRTSLRSTVLDEDRPLLVYTPPGYEQSADSFPVLYLLDGDSHFHHASGVTQFLSANNRMPPMIVVGVPNLTQEGRTHDLTPPLTMPDTAEQFPTAGGGSEFLEFLTGELQPWVEGHYRTRPFSVLVGHSFGGLFATQALIEDPEAFQAYISISPSLWWDDQQFVAGATKIFEEHPDLDGALYMTMGNEGGTMLAGAWSLTSILETSAPESFRWKWTHMPEEDHGSVPHRSLYDGLAWVFEGWNQPDLFALAMTEGGEGWGEIKQHYAMLSERFGFKVQVPEGLVNQVGYYLLGEDRLDDAIGAFEVNVGLYPGSANVYDSVGDAYEAACRWQDAKESYARAYRLGLEQSSPNADTYKDNLDSVTARIESGEECSREPGSSG